MIIGCRGQFVAAVEWVSPLYLILHLSHPTSCHTVSTLWTFP